MTKKTKNLFSKMQGILRKGSAKKLWTLLLTLLAIVNCDNKAFAQVGNKGFLWVVPIDSSALPLGNPLTGNTELNNIFKEHYVEDYYYLDYFFLEATSNYEFVYEIRLEDDYLSDKLCKALSRGTDFFEVVTKPYVCIFTDTCYGYIFLHLINSSALPCSPTRSCNEELNAILELYDIPWYELVFPGTQYCYTFLTCKHTVYLDLYHDLLSLNHLFDDVELGLSGCFIPDKNNTPDAKMHVHFVEAHIDYLLNKNYGPCDVGISNPEQESVIVSPNPAQDYITISGVFPQKITLYDWQGKMIFTKTDHSNRIDLSYLQRGLYFLHIFSDTGAVFFQKIIKE